MKRVVAMLEVNCFILYEKIQASLPADQWTILTHSEFQSQLVKDLIAMGGQPACATPEPPPAQPMDCLVPTWHMCTTRHMETSGVRGAVHTVCLCWKYAGSPAISVGVAGFHFVLCLALSCTTATVISELGHQGQGDAEA